MTSKGTIWSAPDPEAVEARNTIETALPLAARAAEDTVSTWMADVEREVIGPLTELLSRVGRAADSAAAALDAQASGREAWAARCGYVETMEREVLDPIVDHLVRRPPLDRLLAITETASQGLIDAAAVLPVESLVPRPSDLLQPDASDPLAHRVGKWARRQRHGLRTAAIGTRNVGRKIIGRPPLTLPYPLRTVRAREVAEQRLQAHLGPTLAAGWREVNERVTETLAHLDRFVWSWTMQTLEGLAAPDRPSFRVPEGLTIPWRDAAEGKRGDPAPFSPRLEVPTAPSTPPLETTDEALSHRLAADLRVAGTFLYRAPSGPLRPSRGALTPHGNRVLLARELVRLRLLVYDVESGLAGEVASSALMPLQRLHGDLVNRLDLLTRRARTVLAHPSAADESVVHELLGQAGREFDDLLRDLSGLTSADQTLSNTGDDAWRRLMKEVAGLPTDLVVTSLDPAVSRTMRVDLMDLARDAFERPVAPRVGAAADALRRGIARVWAEAEEVEQVVDTTFQTAIGHLEAGAAGDAEAAEVMPELIADGLRRAGESFADRYRSLAPEWSALVTQIHRALESDWGSLLVAVRSDDALTQQWYGLRTRLLRQLERWGADARTGIVRMAHRLAALLRLVRRRAGDLLRKGRSVVGVARATQEERHETIDAVAGVGETYAKLPLVYRRLFSLEPLTDPAVSDHRDADVLAVGRLIDRWAARQGPGVLVCHAPLGSGRTSFLNLMAVERSDALRVVRIRPTGRHRSEAGIVREIAAAFGLPGDSVVDFESLEGVLREHLEARSTLALIDSGELLLEQVPDGTRLLHQVLLFFARTDDRVFWCGAMGTLPWQFVRRTAPSTARLAQEHALAAWTAESVRDLILLRHRRSGIPAVFEAPAEPNPLLAQRLRRARSPEAAQQLLRDDFFESLFRVAGQSPSRALFEWVRAGRFENGTERFVVAPLRPLSFSYLKSLDNDAAFALRALALHDRLSVEDHARIFHAHRSDSVAVFERLLSSGLIEPVAPFVEDAVRPGTPYRLRRLVIEPVVGALRDRNFVH